MAVDIKSLRIGSHILVNDVRATVERLDTYKFPDGKKRPWGYFHGKVNGEYRECGSFLDVDNVEPISITPDLLKELGFEERRMEYKYGASDVWYIDREAAQLEKENKIIVPTIHISSLGKAGYADWWAIRVVTGDKPMRADNCTVRYLHEAEAFLSLHNIELIKE